MPKQHTTNFVRYSFTIDNNIHRIEITLDVGQTINIEFNAVVQRFYLDKPSDQIAFHIHLNQHTYHICKYKYWLGCRASGSGGEKWEEEEENEWSGRMNDDIERPVHTLC